MSNGHQEANMQTTRHYVAWANTTLSLPGADPGISITSYRLDADGHRDETGDWHAVSEDLPRAWGQVEDPALLNKPEADRELERLGYRRTEPWQESGGQWAAEIEPVS